jgi:endonuclease/exonuclease/phosphatase family metal-dependent hydrolase
MNVRFVAWNLAHQIRPSEVSAETLDVLGGMNPDVVVLTEVVPIDDGVSLRAGLMDLGHVSFRLSDYVAGQNRVAISSKALIQPGDVQATDCTPATRSNFLHVRLETHSLDVMGMRVPMFNGYPGAEKAYWAWLEAQAEEWSSRRTVLIGDLNADPKTGSIGGRCLGRLARNGWTTTDPVEPWSYVTGSRLDHALLAPGLGLNGSSFVTEWRGKPIVRKNGTRLSDHALLIADVEC